MAERKAPPALAHGGLREIFPDVFFVTGTVGIPGPLPVRFSRNMVVVRQDGELTLINTIRLDEPGLRELEKLGSIKTIVRIAAFHGMDDPFYSERYDAEVLSVKGQKYVAGFGRGVEGATTYFDPDEEIDEKSELPIRGAKLIVIKSSPPEGLVLLEREGGILISGDCLQNWQARDEYFSFFGGLMMKMMGFIKPYNVGPGWLRAAKPNPTEVRGLLDLSFDHVLPAHGSPAIKNAKSSYRPTLEALR
jgi:hypothetical protein